MRPAMLLVLLLAAAPRAAAQAAPAAQPAVELYRQLSSVGLDPNRTYTVREGLLNREEIRLVLEEGTISFTQAVNGRVTGAFFEGDGQVLLVPPNQVERGTLAQFTKAAVLSERFSAAYLRFNDDVLQELQPALRPPEEAAQFVERWESVARSLALTDALRISMSFWNQTADDRFLHARVIGRSLGTFDVFFDSRSSEQISVAQGATANSGSRYYDVWTAFPMRSARRQGATDYRAQEPFQIEHTRIQARIIPPHELSAEAEITLRPQRDGERMLVFELSRNLQVKSVTLEAGADGGTGGEPAEVIQNEALEGSELARRGNDLIGVVLPQVLAAGEPVRLRFTYAGPVMSEAGGGLMYVGARGIWYPTRGPAMGNFDLEFRYPSLWTLVATGKRVAHSVTGTEQMSRWATQHPMPLAGFNLGQYVTTSVKVPQEQANITIETYAARGVELALQPPPPREPVVIPQTGRRDRFSLGAVIPAAPLPSPAHSVGSLAQRAAGTLSYLSERLGPYPYETLALTQMPGSNSQGWPGLIFLSSYAFLVESAPEKFDALNRILYAHVIPAHEIAHQWWGDAVLWNSYRDQWVVEALSNYYALMELEATDPEAFATVMEHYRRIQLREAENGQAYREAGPVSLGVRLASSKFPDAYEVITYGRGTWLIHMLRSMLRDAAAINSLRSPPGLKAGAQGMGYQRSRSRRAGGKGAVAAPQPSGDELFLRVLRELHQRLKGETIEARHLQQAFEGVLPENLRFEGAKSLEWFFENWVHSTAIPRLHLEGVTLNRKGASTVASGKLLQEYAPDTLITSVPLYASTASGQLMLVARVFADGPETPFRFTVPAGTRKLVVDPYRTVLTRP